ncbi:MAG: winged helix DNA-binding protein, partial [Hyphomicrobiales bacterium]|nr:winged helix DNA-binding protein [Hyphomicrobiales bacterium]
GLTNGQFSLMMMLNAVAAPKMGEVAAFLAMDRTTLTAALKSLERRGLVVTARDEKDRRGKRLSLTDAGRALLAQALPIWTREHATLETSRPQLDGDRLRAQLRALF